MLPARRTSKVIRAHHEADKIIQLCQAALIYSNAEKPAVICTIFPAEVKKMLDQMVEILPDDPDFHDAVVDVFPMSAMPSAILKKDYGFFGIYGYDRMTERDRKRIRPDFCNAQLIVTVVGDEFEAEIPDWSSWDRNKWPEGPHF